METTAGALPSSPRELRPGDDEVARPIYTVWELTMKCDQPCQHCGSRAGHARDTELTTEEVLEVAASLADLGSCAFRADIASMRHETQYSRLFRS